MNDDTRILFDNAGPCSKTVPAVLLNPMKMLEGNRLTMKKFIASAGLVTVGAASLHAAYAPGLTPMETSKPWSLAASLRGFYDDNYQNAPSGPLKKGSGEIGRAHV